MMKKIIILIFTAFLLYSCSDDSEKRVVFYEADSVGKQNIVKFIKETIGDANNKSDEEMEDVIEELRETGVKLYATQKIMLKKDFNNYIQTKNDDITIFKMFIKNFD